MRGATSRRTETFEHDGHRLAFEEIGRGPRVVILVHGLLLSRKMHRPLARSLAREGFRVVSVDLLGHGASDRPARTGEYSMTRFGRQVLALIDHLDAEDAVILGTSLGANTALEAAVLDPTRIRGMVVEMPVLENALIACGLTFVPAFLGLHVGRRPAAGLAALLRRIPTGRLWAADVLLDVLRQDPAPSASVLLGLFFGRIAPPAAERRLISVPTLVLGHHADPIHPFSDAGMLADELPAGRLVEARSMLEMRVAPGRLTEEIVAFLDERFDDEPAARRTPGGARLSVADAG